MGRRGMSLVEVLVAVGLLSAGLMLILSLLPAGVLSMKQAENLQTATEFGQRLVEEATLPASLPNTETNLTYQANDTVFNATRVTTDVPIAGQPSQCFDVDVKVGWEGCQVPVELRLRKLRSP